MVKSQSHAALPSSRPRTRGQVVASTLFLGIGIALAAPGDLDPSFDGNGLLISNLGSAALAVVQQTDGKLVFAGFGTVNLDDGSDFVVLRATGGGTPDATFGTNGVASIDFGGFEDAANAVIQQTDGKLVLAGRAEITNGSEDIALARFNSDGTLDATFGNGGKVTLDIGGSHDFASGLIQQADGKLVIGGGAISGSQYRLVFVRFNADGTLDATFGTGGTRLVDFGGGSESWANDIAQQPDGKLVAVGPVFGPGGRDVAIARVTANGSLDPLFDGDGLHTVDIGGNDDVAMAVAIQPDNKIVAAGSSAPAGGISVDAVLLRINGDGSPDSSFGTAGKAVIDLGVDSLLDAINVQADGQLVAAGTRYTSVGGQDMILARFNSDGALDTTYGIGGVATADFGTGNIAPFSDGVALAQQADGKYVAVGPNSIGSFGAARFDDDAAFPGLIGLTLTSQNVSETAATVTYSVRRTGGTTGTVSVTYATAGGQAQPGSDFQAASGTLTWNDGDAGDRTLSIDLINDAVAEADEDFSLTLSAPSGGVQLAASEATTIIVSEDGPGQLQFTFPLDQMQVQEDLLGEGFRISVPVRRTAGSQGAVSVSYSTTNGTATAGTDFTATSGTLNWADGDTDVKLIEVATLPDSAAEGNEDFQIRLSNPTGGATIAPLGGTQLVRILDNDTGLGFIRTEATVDEADGSVSLSVSRGGSGNGAVSVDYETTSGSATSASDFASASGTLNWADGDTADKTISVDITNDMVEESDETFTVTLSNPSDGTPLAPNSTATVMITDDDPPSGGGGSGGGGGGGLDWFVVLLLSCRYLYPRLSSMSVLGAG